jgi:hypothetical protein
MIDGLRGRTGLSSPLHSAWGKEGGWEMIDALVSTLWG